MIKVFLIDSTKANDFDHTEASADEFASEAKRQTEANGTKNEFNLVEFEQYFNKGGTDSSKEFVRFVVGM